MSLNTLIQQKEEYSINYKNIISNENTIINFVDNSISDINIFLPIKNRIPHIKSTIYFLKRAIDFCRNKALKIKIYILENDNHPHLKKYAEEDNNINYLFIPLNISQSQENIAKSLLFNIGYKLSNRSKWNIFHDSDIIVPNYFFNHLEQYMSNNPNWIQPFATKRVIHINENLTNKILNDPSIGNNIELNWKNNKNEFSYKHKAGAPGGSIVIRNDVFENIGGYDPELFHGYAPEDAFIWMKLESYTNSIQSIPNVIGNAMNIHKNGAIYCDNPPIYLYHLNHIPNYSRHDKLNMSDCLHNLAIITAEEKKKFLEKCKEIFNKFEINENTTYSIIRKIPNEVTVNLYDTAFAHLETQDGKYSVVHGKKSNNIHYIKDRSYNKDNKISIFTEECIFSEDVDKDKSTNKIGWLIETREVNPKKYETIIRVKDKFKFIMTHDKLLLKTYPDKFKFLPFGGCWIQNKNFKLHDKPKMLSMIYSYKTQFTGHKLRHEIVKKLKEKKINIDFLGNGSCRKIQTKEEGLKDYRFSIVIENSNTYNYFTEKLVDSLATATIPIYWGCPNIGEFFNKHGIITFTTIKELENILSILSIDLYNSMLPFIEENIELAKRYEVNENLIYELFKKEEII